MSHSNLVNFYLCIILCHITCLNIKEDCHQPLPLSEYWVETYSGTLSISHLCSMESINVKFNLKSSKKVLHYYTKSRKLHKGNDFRTKEGYLIFHSMFSPYIVSEMNNSNNKIRDPFKVKLLTILYQKEKERERLHDPLKSQSNIKVWLTVYL